MLKKNHNFDKTFETLKNKESLGDAKQSYTLAQLRETKKRK